MASDVRQFQVTVPHGTLSTAPQTTNLSMPPRIVREIRVRIPPGPRGEVGFALGAAGQPVFPFAANTWIVSDDDDIRLPLDNAIDSGAWQLFAYNTGSFDHTLYLTFLCDVVGQGVTSVTTPTVGSGDLGSGTVPVDSGPPPDVPPVGTQPPPPVLPPITVPPVPPIVPPGQQAPQVTPWGLPTAAPWVPCFSP